MLTLAALTVSAFLSNGVTCSGPALSTQSATTPRANVSLCLSTTEKLCGITYRLMPSSAGTLRVNSRTIGPAFGDTTQAITFPRALIREKAGDWGGTLVDLRAPLPAGKHLVATYNLTVLASAPATDYRIALDPISSVTIDPDGRCGALPLDADPRKSYPVVNYLERPLAATFTIHRN